MNPWENGMVKAGWLNRLTMRGSVVLLGAVAVTLQISAADLGALFEYVRSLQPQAIPPFILQLFGIARHSNHSKPGLPSFRGERSRAFESMIC
jgi:hypothetical protein